MLQNVKVDLCFRTMGALLPWTMDSPCPVPDQCLAVRPRGSRAGAQIDPGALRG